MRAFRSDIVSFPKFEQCFGKPDQHLVTFEDPGSVVGRPAGELARLVIDFDVPQYGRFFSAADHGRGEE